MSTHQGPGHGHGNPKKKKGKHRQRPVGGFSDSGPGGMSPPAPTPPGVSPHSSSSNNNNDGGGDESHDYGSASFSFPSQAAPHSSDDHEQRQPPAGGGPTRAAPAATSWPPAGAGEWGKPTLHLHSSIEGLFKEQDHNIGGSFSDAALEHWRQLDSAKKLEVVTVSRDGIFDALRELHLTAQVEVEGEPGEEAAQAVVKDFLYALEVQDGKFRFPESPTLEYIGIFVALETNLLLSMEETNVLQHAVMVWLLLLWRLPGPYWWLGYLLTLVLVLANLRPCAALRGGVRRVLNATFLERRRWHSFVHWRSEAFFVSLLTIALAGGAAGWSPRWYWAAVAMALGQLALDHHALRTCAAGKGDEQTGAVALRQGLLWMQKVLLLVLAWPAWSTLAVVVFYYWPAAGVLGLTLLYLGTGVGIRLFWALLHDYGLARLAPRAKAGLDAWWHEGRDGLNRAAVVAVVALLVVPYTFYRTWDWTPNWKGTAARILSVLVVANVVSVEDINRAWTEAKAALGRRLGRKKAPAAASGGAGGRSGTDSGEGEEEEEEESEGGEGEGEGKKEKKKGDAAGTGKGSDTDKTKAD